MLLLLSRRSCVKKKDSAGAGLADTDTCAEPRTDSQSVSQGKGLRRQESAEKSERLPATRDRRTQGWVQKVNVAIVWKCPTNNRRDKLREQFIERTSSGPCRLDSV